MSLASFTYPRDDKFAFIPLPVLATAHHSGTGTMLDKANDETQADTAMRLKRGYRNPAVNYEAEIIDIAQRADFDVFDVIRHYIDDNKAVIPACSHDFEPAFRRWHNRSRKLPVAKFIPGRMRVMFADMNAVADLGAEDHIRIRQTLTAKGHIEQTVKQGGIVPHHGVAIHERMEYKARVAEFGVNPYAIKDNTALRDHLARADHRAVQVTVAVRATLPFIVRKTGHVFKVEAEFYDAAGCDGFHEKGGKVEIEAVVTPVEREAQFDTLAAQHGYLTARGFPIAPQQASAFVNGLNSLDARLGADGSLRAGFNARAGNILWRDTSTLYAEACGRLGRETMMALDFQTKYKL